LKPHVYLLLHAQVDRDWPPWLILPGEPRCRTLAKGKKPMTRADLSPSPAERALRDEVMQRDIWLEETGREVQTFPAPGRAGPRCIAR
jgi:hypothetical protein